MGDELIKRFAGFLAIDINTKNSLLKALGVDDA